MNASTNTSPLFQTEQEQRTAFGKSQESLMAARKFFKAHPQSMTLDALLQANLPIYVKNNVSRAGRIAVDFTINGRKQAVNIPNTWIAIRLNDHMTGADIASSGSLRDMLRKEVLVLIHPDTAEDEYATERGKRELVKQKSALAKSDSSSLAVRNVPASDVSDRMKALTIEYTSAKDDNDRTIVGDTIFGNVRTFSRLDVEYFASKTADTAQGVQLAKELMESVESRKA